MLDPATDDRVVESIRLRPGVFAAHSSDGRTLLSTRVHAELVGRLGAAERAVLRRRLAEGAWSAHQLSQEVGVRDDDGPAVDALLAALRRGGWLTVTVTMGQRALYTLQPVRPAPPMEPGRSVDGDRVCLSRFAILRRDTAGFLAESPLGWCEVRLHDPFLLGALLGGDGAAALPSAIAARVRSDLRWAGILVSHGEEGEAESSLRTRQWGLHELWLHERSRITAGRASGYGRTMWAAGRFAPPPERSAPAADGAVPLWRPDLDACRASDPPLTQVLEQRRSVRVHDDRRPITARQLGEFLYRCAGLRTRAEADWGTHDARPYPGGGGRHELEIYPVVRLVEELAPGIYRYDPHVHGLERVGDNSAPARRLLHHAARSIAPPNPPQVLLVVAARFGRIMWCYEAMAYALILKNVGVLYQTMYLVATAMGLAACGLGGGSSEDFAEATGLDPLVESSVGEFMLGTRRPEERP